MKTSPLIPRSRTQYLYVNYDFFILSLYWFDIWRFCFYPEQFSWIRTPMMLSDYLRVSKRLKKSDSKERKSHSSWEFFIRTMLHNVVNVYGEGNMSPRPFCSCLSTNIVKTTEKVKLHSVGVIQTFYIIKLSQYIAL